MAIPVAGTAKSAQPALHTAERIRSVSRQNAIVKDQDAESRPRIPPPPALTDAVVAAYIPRNDNQSDTAARYQANFTGAPAIVGVQRLVPPLPPGYEAYAPQVFSPPMVTFHVCRICLRPRSDKYHRDRPIAPYAIPPPPGICRRCRISGTDEQAAHVEVVRIMESGPVRFGLDCVLPAKDILTRQQVKEETNERTFDERVRVVRTARSPTRLIEKSAKEAKVVYRYVITRGEPQAREITLVSEVSAENIAALDAIIGQQKVAVDDSQSAVIAKLPNAAVDKTPIETSVIRQANARGKSTPRHDYSESDIRRFARDEIVRYRQAERSLKTHPEPYAHGRLRPLTQEHRQTDRPAPPRQIAPSLCSIDWAPRERPTSELPARPSVERVERAYRSTKRDELAVDREVRYYHDGDKDDSVPAAKRGQSSILGKIDAQDYQGGALPTTGKGKRPRAPPASPQEGSHRAKIDRTESAPHDSIARRLHPNDAGAPEPIIASEKKIVPNDTYTTREVTVTREVVDTEHSPHYLPPFTNRSSKKELDRGSVRRDQVVNPSAEESARERVQPVRFSKKNDKSSAKDSSTVGRSSLDVLADDSLPLRRSQSLTDSARPAIQRSHDGRDIWYEDRTRDIRANQLSGRPVEAVNIPPTGCESGHFYNTSSKRDQNHTKTRAGEERQAVEYEYEFRERTNQPADRPMGSLPFNDTPPLLIQESETLFIYRPRFSKDSAAKDSAPRKKPGLSANPGIPGNSSLSQLPAGSKSSMRTAGMTKSSARDNDGERSTQVRFANKVVISPTPPTSDDYPPSSEKRKDRVEVRRAERHRGQVDVNQIYEGGVHHERAASDRRGRTSQQTGPGSDRTTQRMANRHSTREQPYKRLPSLAEAMSESPSREEYEIRRRAQQEQRSRTPARRKCGPIDRHGPYRREVLDESMIAACGSSFGPAPGTTREV